MSNPYDDLDNLDDSDAYSSTEDASRYIFDEEGNYVCDGTDEDNTDTVEDNMDFVTSNTNTASVENNTHIEAPKRLKRGEKRKAKLEAERQDKKTKKELIEILGVSYYILRRLELKSVGWRGRSRLHSLKECGKKLKAYKRKLQKAQMDMKRKQIRRVKNKARLAAKLEKIRQRIKLVQKGVCRAKEDAKARIEKLRAKIRALSSGNKIQTTGVKRVEARIAPDILSRSW